MPNWVLNKVQFNGNEEDVKKLREFVKSEETVFDFDKIVPMPEELNITSGSEETIAIACAKARRNGETTSSEFEKSWAKGRTFDEWADLGEKYLSNLEKYGATTWYDWRWDNWGTKWNSSDAYWDSENEVSFSTAWNAPEFIYRKLAELFPDIPFRVSFADEDLGSNCGLFDYDGRFFSVSFVDDYEFACEIWGIDPEDMIDEEPEEIEEDEEQEEIEEEHE